VVPHLIGPARNTAWTILVSFALIQWLEAQPATLQWSRSNPSGTLPSPRIDAPIAYDPVGRQLFMFGGLDGAGDRNDLWAYSVDNNQWSQINPTGQAPSPRHGHTVTFDPVRRRVIVIAGQGAVFFGDAWAYDIQINAWVQLSGNTSGPNPRYGLSAIYDARRDRMVISHGFTSDGRFDDTWALDLKSNSWSDISPNGTRPLRRCLHHAVYVPQSDQMLLYGGCSSGFGPCPQGDLWSFDLAANQWTQIITTVSPAPRQRYGMAFDDHQNRMVLFGGLGGPPLNDTWEYDPVAAVWSQLAPAGDVPSARYRLEAAFASDLATAFFFGGQTDSYTNDLLLLSTSPSVGPQIAAGGIQDVFSGAAGPFAPGELVAIAGSSLGPSTGLSSVFDPVTNTLPITSGGVSVTVNGVSAPLYYVSAGQVNIQIPYEVGAQSPASVSVSYNGIPSAAQTFSIVASAPRMYPGIFNADGSLNSAANPASAGSIVILFATGYGITNPQSISGKSAAAPYPQPVGPVRVSIGGQDAEILFAGSAPETVGVIQVNVKLPAAITGTTTGVLLTVGDSASQNGVMVTVQ
jgi:uncharacterized protein (TIGR03437 family)